MSEVRTVQLEWKYTPENYLEEPISISVDGVTIELSNGLAVANIAPEVFESNATLRDELTRAIESQFHAVQITTHRDFELCKSLLTIDLLT